MTGKTAVWMQSEIHDKAHIRTAGATAIRIWAHFFVVPVWKTLFNACRKKRDGGDGGKCDFLGAKVWIFLPESVIKGMSIRCSCVRTVEKLILHFQWLCAIS